MVISDGELETDLPFAPIYGISGDSNLSHLNMLDPSLNAYREVQLRLDTLFYGSPSSRTCSDQERMQFYRRALVLTMIIPVLSLSGHAGHGVPHRFFFLSFFLSFFFFFTAVRRCRPGVRCCSDRCGYDRGMSSKDPGAIDLWVIWCSLRSKVRDAWLVQLNIIQPSEDEPWTVQPATSNFRVVWSQNERWDVGIFCVGIFWYRRD